MSAHTYTRLVGFGLTVIPRTPFVLAHADDPTDAVDVTHQAGPVEYFVRVIPFEGGYRSKIDQHTKSLYDVVDIEKGPALDAWRLETSVFTCAWPKGFEVHSTDFPTAPAPFELVGPNSALIFFQFPSETPELESLCSSEQRVVARGGASDSDWIEFAYAHGGATWRQRYAVGKRGALTYMLTAQYLEGSGNSVLDAMEELRESVIATS